LNRKMAKKQIKIICPITNQAIHNN